MKADTFTKVILDILKNVPEVPTNSFFQSSVKAIGRKFESKQINASGALAELERLLPWQLSRDIKKNIEKSLR